MYLTNTINGAAPRAALAGEEGEAEEQTNKKYSVKRHIRRHFDAFWRCVNEDKQRLKAPKGFKLRPGSFDFFKWDEKNVKKEKKEGATKKGKKFNPLARAAYGEFQSSFVMTSTHQSSGEDEDGEEESDEEGESDAEAAYYGPRKEREARAKFFEGDELCPEYAEPDPAFIGPEY
eukprot:g12230.t1